MSNSMHGASLLEGHVASNRNLLIDVLEAR